MTKKTNITLGGKSYTRETLKAELKEIPNKGLLAGKGNYYSSDWGYNKRSTSPVSAEVIKKIKGRSGFKKDLLVDVIVATVFGDPLPKAAVPLTKEEKEAKRKAEIAERKKFKAPKAPLQDLTEEQARFLSNAVMTHPGGCDSGKKEFIKRLGLPLPPPRVSVAITIEIPVDEEDTVKDSYYGGNKLSATAVSKIRKQVTASLPEGAKISRGLSTQDRITVNE